MKKIIFLLSIIAMTIPHEVPAQGKAKATTEHVVEMTTNYGVMKIKLYNETPKHRDNFLKLAKEGYYSGTLFHRVMKEFMLQGGDPNSKTAKPGQQLGSGDLGYTVPAEFNSALVHKKGALCAARTENPEKASSSCQFYIVQGKKVTDGELDAMEGRNGIKYTPAQREAYRTSGGTPFLDMNYTVYGEVISGMDVIDKICAVKTAPGDRPVEDVKIISVKIIK